MACAIRYLNIALCILVLCDVTRTPCSGQQRNRNSNKFKGGGKFIPGKSRLGNKPYYPPRARRPTIGDILKRQQASQPKRRRPTTNHNVDHSDPEAVNRMNYLTNLRNNNHASTGNQRANAPVPQPNVGKITPPLVRSEGEKPPFSPSWTHCVISIQVSIAWVVVKSPHYPNKFQGQVQCSWIATAMEGYRVRLSFKDLDLLPPNGEGCGSQFVEIIDMDLEKSQARFCGTQVPGDYVSNGNKLRLDLQADAIATPYRGFMAAFKADQEIPGRRETSYFAHGIPQMLYNPLTQSPPSNPIAPRAPARRPVVRTTTKPRAPLIPGQKIYGANNQPRNEVKNTKPEETSSTSHLYIIIAVILVILLAAAGAYVFKRCFYKQFIAWRKRQKHGKDWQEASEMQDIGNGNDIYSKQKQLPGNMPLPPTPDVNGHRPPMGMGYQGNGFFGGHPNGMTQDGSMFRHPSMTSVDSGHFGLHRSASMGDISNNGWGQQNNEPIYEDDDAMSVRSMASVRSSNRHPEHEAFKRQKLLERQNSLRMRRNSISGQYPPQGEDIYNVLTPYPTHSLYGEQRHPYGYGQMDAYGSLPPTMGPNANGMYGSYPPPYGQLYPHQPMFTSSTSNLVGPTGNMGVERTHRRSASLYDVTDEPLKPEVKSQWSDQLNQRIPSVASSTNNSAMSSGTNPILKKTRSTQNELAFTALRAAKSMNDLTAINTKLNECVSWTLPSQRRKSIVG